jgi:hypothetical protein
MATCFPIIFVDVNQEKCFSLGWWAFIAWIEFSTRVNRIQHIGSLPRYSGYLSPSTILSPKNCFLKIWWLIGSFSHIFATFVKKNTFLKAFCRDTNYNATILPSRYRRCRKGTGKCVWCNWYVSIYILSLDGWNLVRFDAKDWASYKWWTWSISFKSWHSSNIWNQCIKNRIRYKIFNFNFTSVIRLISNWCSIRRVYFSDQGTVNRITL